MGKVGMYSFAHTGPWAALFNLKKLVSTVSYNVRTSFPFHDPVTTYFLTQTIKCPKYRPAFYCFKRFLPIKRILEEKLYARNDIQKTRSAVFILCFFL